MTATKISGPHTRCRSTASTRSLGRVLVPSVRVTVRAITAAIHSYRRSARYSSGTAPGSRNCDFGTSSARAMQWRTRSTPSCVVATVGTTIAPSAWMSSTTSTFIPASGSRSTRLSTTTVGRPSSSTSVARYRLRSRFSASSTTTNTSTGATPSARSCTTS